MIIAGAWSLFGVLWGNHVGTYFDDLYMMNIIYEWDSYTGDEKTLYGDYPAYKTALGLKLSVSFIHTVVGVVTFRDWFDHVEY